MSALDESRDASYPTLELGPPGRYAGALAALIAFVLLAALVSLGKLTRIDQYAVHHLMPSLSPSDSTMSILDGVKPYRGHFHVQDAVLFMGAAIPSSVAAALLAALLWRRGRLRAGVVWCVLFAAGVAAEVLGKSLLDRPALYASSHGAVIHVAAFDTSFPSWHVLRATILAGLVAALWPRLGRLAALWVAAVAVLLEIGGFHTPTDIAGGLLLGGALVLVGRRARSDAE